MTQQNDENEIRNSLAKVCRNSTRYDTNIYVFFSTCLLIALLYMKALRRRQPHRMPHSDVGPPRRAAASPPPNQMKVQAWNCMLLIKCCVFFLLQILRCVFSYCLPFIKFIVLEFGLAHYSHSQTYVKI